MLAVRRDASPFNDLEDAAVFERYRKELEEDVAAERRYAEVTPGRSRDGGGKSIDHTAKESFERDWKSGLAPRPWFLGKCGEAFWTR